MFEIQQNKLKYNLNKLPRSRAFEVLPENYFSRSKAAGN
jgi:hypothetical protein